MRFVIHPLVGVNDVKFGMSPEQVRQTMAVPFQSGPWRNSSPNFPTDHFHQAGAFAYYDADGCLEAMEFHPPARLLLEGTDLLALSASKACSMVYRLDPQAVGKFGSLYSRRLSLAVVLPDEGDELFGPVLVGRAGYCDFIDQC